MAIVPKAFLDSAAEYLARKGGTPTEEAVETLASRLYKNKQVIPAAAPAAAVEEVAEKILPDVTEKTIPAAATPSAFATLAKRMAFPLAGLGAAGTAYNATTKKEEPAASVPPPAAPVPAPDLAGLLASPAPVVAAPAVPKGVSTGRLEKAYATAKDNYSKAFTPLTPEDLAARDTEKLQRQQELTKQLLAATKDDPEYKKYGDTLAKVDTAMTDAKKAIASDRETAGWLGAMEKISQALATYSAARYGLDKGVDVVGGMKLQPTDWNNIMKGSIEDLKQELENLHDQKKLATKGQEGITASARDRAERLALAGDVARTESDKLSREGLTKVGDLGVKEAKDIITTQLQQQRNDAALARVKPATSPEVKTEKQLATNELKTNLKTSDSLKKIIGDLTSIDAGTLTKAGLANTKARINQQLSAAGIDPTAAQKETGWLFKSMDTDPSKTKELIQQRLGELDRRNGILTSTIRGGGPVPTARPGVVAPTVRGSQVLVRNDGVEVNVPADKVQAALATGNYKVK